MCAGRKKSPLDPSCCPVCGITLRSSDLENHFVQEIERLERVSRSSRSTSAAGHSSVSPSSSSLSAPSSTQVHKREQDTRWEVANYFYLLLCFLNYLFIYLLVYLFIITSCINVLSLY